VEIINSVLSWIAFIRRNHGTLSTCALAFDSALKIVSQHGKSGYVRSGLNSKSARKDKSGHSNFTATSKNEY
jgi:hypothetical protein